MNLAVVPEPWKDWLLYGIRLTSGREITNSAVADPSFGLWTSRLDPSPGLGYVTWNVRDDDSARRVGLDLARRLEFESIPVMMALLDRREFLERIRRIHTPFPGLRTSRKMAELALLVDDISSPERESILASYRRGPKVPGTLHDRLLSWVDGRTEALGTNAR